MARGITEIDVHTAADEIVAAGERPTVERIRAHLGTGSPNTVTRWLDSWWRHLGTRLTAQQVRVALPEAPAAVAALASQLWEQALVAAQEQAQTDLAEVRLVLDAERNELENARQATRDAEAAAATSIETAHQAQVLAEARLAESQRLIDQQAVQLADMGRQRETLAEQAAATMQTAQVLRDRLQAQEAAAAAERDSQTQHMRSVEDRAHAEVDRAREETKALRHEYEAVVRTQTEAQRSWRQELAAAHAAVGPKPGAKRHVSRPVPKPWSSNWPNSRICQPPWRRPCPVHERHVLALPSRQLRPSVQNPKRQVVDEADMAAHGAQNPSKMSLIDVLTEKNVL